MDLNLGDTQALLKRCKEYKLPREQVAYVLATAYWETGRTMKPVREAYWLSEGWRQRNLWYYPWYGRGYVQLTLKANYEKVERIFKRPVTKDRDLVMDPALATEITVRGMKEGWFTGKRLDHYINDDTVDYVGARKIINGEDRASTIASIAKDYYDDLEGYTLEEPKHWLTLLIESILKGFKK